MPTLFDPLTIRGATMRNRIWVSPMCQYSVHRHDGVPHDWHRVHLGSFAVGGAGLVITEATAVSPEGRITPADTGIWNDDQRDAWASIVDFVRRQGAVPGMQLGHAGRKASTWAPWGNEGRHGTIPVDEGGWQTVSASDLSFGDDDAPVPLDSAGIDKVVSDFVGGARRAVDAGFRLLEIHGAHGYLVHQFLSPLSNRRTDEYGGSLPNRARLLLRVVRAIRAEIPDDIALIVRLSASDYAEGGWDQEQTATVAGWAAEAGADFFDISSGGLVTGVHIPLGPSYQVPFADFVKHTSGVAVGSVGLITTSRQAAAIVEDGRADAVLLAREMLRDPHFPLRAAHELGVQVDYWPQQYLRARWPED